MLTIPPLILLELRFKTLAPITNLPFYHGVHWNALLRDLLEPRLPQGMKLADAGIWLHPVETGVVNYDAGEPIHLGLTFPSIHASAVSAALTNFNAFQSPNQFGHFIPGKRIAFESAKCRITGEPWNSDEPHCLTPELLDEETAAFSRMVGFTLRFTSPLHVLRPEGSKTPGHNHCDEDYFLRSVDPAKPLAHFLKRLSARAGAALAQAQTTDLRATGGALSWVGISYGKKGDKDYGTADDKTTLSGSMGSILVKGVLTPEEACLLVAGQYLGVGQKATFGFGFYTIPELDSIRKIKPLTRAMPLVNRAMTLRKLNEALNSLSDSAPGPDYVKVSDVKSGGAGLLTAIGEKVVNGIYDSGQMIRNRIPKADGGAREIVVQNVIDRLVQRAAADCLLPSLDSLMHESSFAYRRGRNRRDAAQAVKSALAEGFTEGIKVDIASFFDSVNIDALISMMAGLYPYEPIVDRITEWLRHSHTCGARGLPQGNPLSPMLSNLYLDRFDRELSRKPKEQRLVRYADDIVVLYKPPVDRDQCVRDVECSLSTLGLRLNAEKTSSINKNNSVRFLGYEITATSIVEFKKERSDKDDDWPQVFTDQWREGTPVYLTSICHGAFSSGPTLVVKQAAEEQMSIPWSRISRMVVVGRSPFSGSVVYNAVKHGIPITFIDVMGRSAGNLYPENAKYVDLSADQRKGNDDREFRLSVARELVAAQINNRAVLLARNKVPAPELKTYEDHAMKSPDLDVLRGYEGSAARVFFERLAKIVSPFEFHGRKYYPPDGPVNVMLSLGYSLLRNRITMALRDNGFNPRIGIFHEGRGTHAALASDLVEELRHIAERITLALIHRGEIKPGDFTVDEKKGLRQCRMNGEAFRTYIHQYETTMATKISYHGGVKMSYNAYLDEMANKLRRSMKLRIPYQALRIY